MSYCSLFEKSDQQTKSFLLNIFDFLMQFYLNNDQTVKSKDKEKLITQSLMLIKYLILYYDLRDLLIEDINNSHPMFICNKERFSTFFKKLSHQQKAYYKPMYFLYDHYLEKLFNASQSIYICTKDSKKSIVWKNSNQHKIIIYKLTT